MNKKIKLASALLSTSLVVTPVSGIIYQNDNVAKAENKDIKEVVYIKNSEILNILEQKYKNNEISKEDYQIIKSELQLRWGPQGTTKVVIFLDGAFDLYLNSYLSYAVSASISGATALITGLLAAAGVSGGASAIPVSAIATFIGMVAGTELSRGVIVYFKRISPSPSGFGAVNYYPSQIRKQ
ncbi:hypothetical protein HZY83_06665 [Gemella sp. GH3]|uniref:hypothetical protein n=1 Tax=unclassified Gemella TaxID=2624949 RepID=UPI0015D0ACE4|nr:MULTISPECIES: hypothetical protein [unclassified Gemella]MBF0714355.1 hypothetical protein [Gemella sp. GH3.1]NYS51307.1 hypothetical protein [Gemella sp. GH3]